uniref:Eukaryotic translation initiation factor 3 subunit G n=1 Tax=Hirondellea gigas TaxID=1518452 RepID=A0A2P2I0B0_9CRUS
MPSIDDQSVKDSWADDSDVKDLPPSTEKVDGNTKILVEYSYDENEKLVKTVSTFRIEKHRVSKAIATRKAWKKFGVSVGDKPGPNPATTITAEEISMQFVTIKDEEEAENEDVKKKLMDQAKGQVKCRLCKEDHWTKQCPFKDQLDPLRTSLMGEEKDEDGAAPGEGGSLAKALGVAGAGGKYIPPSMREGANKRGDSMGLRNRDETSTVRVTNLSESTREQDLQELFRPFGDIVRIFLAKDKMTGISKGFAFINFKRRDEAAKAISVLEGYGYDHLILNVEWAKPSGTQ